MSKERISMVNIRELLRLYEEKQTKRQIARACVADGLNGSSFGRFQTEHFG